MENSIDESNTALIQSYACIYMSPERIKVACVSLGLLLNSVFNYMIVGITITKHLRSSKTRQMNWACTFLHCNVPAFFALLQVSISPTFYKHLFQTKVLCAAFMSWPFGCVIFRQKEIGAKAALKMLVKLTTAFFAVLQF